MRNEIYKSIVDFCAKHNDAESALQDWYYKTLKANWSCFADIRKTFNTVDAVGNSRYVFNIKGNDYGLVALVLFQIKKVYVRFIGTHKAYDNTDCSTI